MLYTKFQYILNGGQFGDKPVGKLGDCSPRVQRKAVVQALRCGDLKAYATALSESAELIDRDGYISGPSATRHRRVETFEESMVSIPLDAWLPQLAEISPFDITNEYQGLWESGSGRLSMEMHVTDLPYRLRDEAIRVGFRSGELCKYTVDFRNIEVNKSALESLFVDPKAIKRRAQNLDSGEARPAKGKPMRDDWFEAWAALLEKTLALPEGFSRLSTVECTILNWFDENSQTSPDRKDVTRMANLAFEAIRSADEKRGFFPPTG